MIKIHAVIENANSPLKGKPPWPVAEWDFFIRLYPWLSDEEIGSVMIATCVKNKIQIASEASETLTNFLLKERVRFWGGLTFVQNSDVKIIPGCCCWLDEWRQWLHVPDGNNLVWTGHDPQAWVEYVNGKIRVWADRKDRHNKKKNIDYIELDKKEMIVLLKGVESDLNKFLSKLEKWVSFISPQLERKVVEHFAKNMNIWI